MDILTVRNISKRFGRKPILTNISFRANAGDTIGILGPVGVGKTTLLYVLMGLIAPDSGTVNILSQPLSSERPFISQHMNAASSALRLNGYASISENLMTFARLYRVRDAETKIRALTKKLGLENLVRSNIKVYKLSAGENTKLNLCKALLNDPRILFLDEITAYLDPPTADAVHRLLKTMTGTTESAVLYATHNLSEVQRICTKVLLLKKNGWHFLDKVPERKTLLRYYETP